VGLRNGQNNNTNNMNDTFTTLEIQDLIKDFIDDSFKDFIDDFLAEEPTSFYTDLLNSGLEVAKDLEGAKEKIVKVFRNKATRMIFVNAVILATNASKEAKAIGIQIPFTSLLIDLAKIA
jgi:hypothetical protein